MMKIHFQRENQFIVEKDKNFYLVNLGTDGYVLADPPDSPDMFLKLGYFEDPEINKEIEEKINKILENI